jgi:hypothetical protein
MSNLIITPQTIRTPNGSTDKYLNLNDTLKIHNSAITTTTSSGNQDAKIWLKDINSTGSGTFYPIHVDSLEYSGTPYLYFNGNVIIDAHNLLSELETILAVETLDLSNLMVTGGYINFSNGGNSNVGPDGVGLRYSANSNTVQFRSELGAWTDLSNIGGVNQFRDLLDVDVTSNPLLNNQYITYNAGSNLFVNSNLAIINDPSPTVSNDLNMANNNIVFSASNLDIIFSNGSIANPVVSLVNNTTSNGIGNYLEIENADTGLDPSITCIGIDTNIGVDITVKGTGDIRLNASTGNIYTNSDSIVIGGFQRNSIYRTSTKPGGYIADTTWNIPLNTDIILFDFGANAAGGTYYANVSAGLDGQKMNMIFNNKSSNSVTVLANFNTSNLLVGTGYCNGFVFNNTGQSTMLVYLADDIDSWQTLNTGAGVF